MLASAETFPNKVMRRLLTCCFLTFLLYCGYNLQSSPQPYNGVEKPLNLRIEPSHQSSVAEIFPAEKIPVQTPLVPEKTNLSHVVFRIAASSKHWNRRKNYTKLWWKPGKTRGFVWLDEAVEFDSKEEENSLPPWKISEKTSEFKYENTEGNRSAIRIARIVSEMVRLNMDGVRWYVMGDDDTVFVPENLVRVLQKYDHTQFYYIGSSSESHLQNILFTDKMAFGGGGFAVSAALAAELAKVQDRCMHRYAYLYGSDDRMQSCMAELGVPLTKELGFHQFDVYGSVFGLLAAHPVTPLVSLHHLDVIEPIFPNTDRVNAIKKLSGPMGLDSAALAQQSICYDPTRNWTISVSWGYAVQIFRGVLLPRDVECPTRTFLNWHPETDHNAHAFKTRPYSEDTCQMPFVYYLSEAKQEPDGNRTVSEYGLNREGRPECQWKMVDPSRVEKVAVHKKPDLLMWEKAPRRNCCRTLPTKTEGTLLIDVGVCREGEVAEM